LTATRRRWLSVGTLAAAALIATQLAGAPAAQADSQLAARVLYYNASGAAEFVSAVNQGAANWNASVTNVKLQPVPAGGRANITIVADNGWPRAQTTSLGNGRIWVGREAVNDGYYVPRITTHEFGHILGLPDRRTGLCSDLMSGSSAPVSCKNDRPSAAEARQVNANFAGALAAATPATFNWES
jgi:snapalysin